MSNKKQDNQEVEIRLDDEDGKSSASEVDIDEENQKAALQKDRHLEKRRGLEAEVARLEKVLYDLQEEILKIRFDDSLPKERRKTLTQEKLHEWRTAYRNLVTTRNKQFELVETSLGIGFTKPIRTVHPFIETLAQPPIHANDISEELLSPVGEKLLLQPAEITGQIQRSRSFNSSSNGSAPAQPSSGWNSIFSLVQTVWGGSFGKPTTPASPVDEAQKLRAAINLLKQKKNLSQADERLLNQLQARLRQIV